MLYDVIFFIGPPGSGKGTQARVLAEQLGFYFWEMGGILRSVAKEDSVMGKKVDIMLTQGILFPDEFLLEIVAAKLGDIPEGQGIIFDGIPRRLGQAEFLLDYLKKIGKQKFATLFIDIPKSISLERLLLRSQKEGRSDDTREAIEFRLEQYEKDTVPVLDFLKANSSFITIDGVPPVEVVTEQINAVIN